jgi:hypothetical protein
VGKLEEWGGHGGVNDAGGILMIGVHGGSSVGRKPMSVKGRCDLSHNFTVHYRCIEAPPHVRSEWTDCAGDNRSRVVGWRSCRLHGRVRGEEGASRLVFGYEGL